MPTWFLLLIFIGLAIVGLFAVSSIQIAWIPHLSAKPFAPTPKHIDSAKGK